MYLCIYYVAGVRLSVYLSHRSIAAMAANGFAVERSAGMVSQSMAAGAVLQVPALSSKRG